MVAELCPEKGRGISLEMGGSNPNTLTLVTAFMEEVKFLHDTWQTFKRSSWHLTCYSVRLVRFVNRPRNDWEGYFKLI